MKFRLFVLSALLFAALSQSAYGQLRNLSVTSYEVVSYNIFSDKLTLKVTIRNDSNDFTIRSFSGLVFQDRQPLVFVTAANLFIPHDVSTIGVVCNIRRCTGVSLFRLIHCLISFDILDYTVDVAVAVQYPGAAIEFKEQKGITLSSRVEFF